MDNLNQNVNVQNMKKSLEIATSILASNPEIDCIVKQANKVSGMFSFISATQKALEITRKFDNIFSGHELITAFSNAFVFQNELLHNTQNYFITETISSFRNLLAHNDFSSAVQTLSKAFELPIIEAPNIALLKLNKSLHELTELQLPKGMRSAINNLHINTAQELSVSDSVSYDSNRTCFFIEAEPENMCTAGEANVLYSVTRLFDELTDKDMFSFLCHLSSYPALGLDHCVGQKILKIVKNIESVISFDSEIYYHARLLDDGACPYTYEDMTRAPHGITSFGRFNHTGENYFYFSNEEIGAVNEVRKHNRRSRVQVAKLKAKGNIKMIDISQDVENTFLKYCRFSVDPKSNKKVPREYLIPSFFSNCCKLKGVDGIKYYGTKDYLNYVTWNDGHFDFIDCKFIDNP